MVAVLKDYALFTTPPFYNIIQWEPGFKEIFYNKSKKNSDPVI